ncbi:DUF4190 domain-containing protein [Paenibacillus protaetiae]|uniref:DUF4190 domain-containing protein n=1 Tax=Paenibacillus protaetiae TaxID=2509456 RepID=UPI0013EB532D|nr:DUF4190 domain-containing protein [Paenibacillus protaetiae]
MHRYEDEGKDKQNREQHLKELNRDFNEEMGADFAAGGYAHRARTEQSSDDSPISRPAGYSLGWVALVFAAVSWFVWPVLLGITSAVLGFIAYTQGARRMGAWSMAIGLIAAAVYLVIIPFYYAVT